jgi:cytoskeletal protein RodZ
MFNLNLQYIAGGLAIFFITLAIYKGLSQKASKRESAAKSLEQSHVGQEPEVSLHNPFSGASVPEAPPPAENTQPPPPPPSAPVASAPAPYQPPASATPPATPPTPPTPEEIYKWN